MNFSQAVKMALKSINSSKMRTFLTMLGIVIGVCAVIVLVSVVQGSTNDITDSIESLGANRITLTLTGRNQTKRLDMDELEQFREEHSDLIQYVVPSMTTNGTLKYSNRNMTASVNGSSADYLAVNNREVSQGRFLNSLDVSERRKNVVIGSYNAMELFGFDDPLGKQIKINGQIFTVIGVLKEISDSEEGSEDDMAIIPYTAGRTLFYTNRINSYTVWASSKETVESATDALETFLFDKFGDEDDYRIISVASMMDTLDEITGMMTLLTAGIAGISLVVGGIGIMNIMLVSVTERTREIGIRKAIGAKRISIMAQFLIESIVVSCMGGIVGILLGIAGSVGLGIAMGVNAFPQPYVMLGAFVFSALVGTFFGWAPASKASKLNPIDALHAD